MRHLQMLALHSVFCATAKGDGAKGSSGGAAPAGDAQNGGEAAPASGGGATPLRKITIRDVSGSIDTERLKKLLALPKGETLWLCEIYGVSARLQPGQSDLGPYVKFGGMFKAKNLETGEIFRASICILPRYLEDALAGAMSATGQSAEFAIRVGATINPNAKAGGVVWMYTEQQLIAPQENDALKAIEARIAQVPLLAAPK